MPRKSKLWTIAISPRKRTAPIPATTPIGIANSARLSGDNVRRRVIHTWIRGNSNAAPSGCGRATGVDRSTPEGVMQILVALDESPYCDAVIRMIIDEMKRADITLHLLHIVDPFPTKLAEAKGSEEYPDYAAGRHEEVEDADRLLQRAAARLRDAGFKITSVIREGDPLISILAEAAVSR